MINKKELYKQVKPYQHHKLVLKPKKSALLVIDMQNDFFNPKSPAYTENVKAIVSNLQILVATARKHKTPIIYTAHCHQDPKLDGGMTAQWWSDIRNKQSLVAGSKGAQIIDQLKPLQSEKIIFKHRYSAFYNTDLEIYLRGLSVTDLIITGIMTGICVESTARDAFFRDFRIFVVGDGTAAGEKELHINSLKILAYAFAYVTDTKNILRMIKK
ncbi:MAG: cysteine hydrolase [Candidatus Latescibacteria bacterium]|nr:cysteine hydrolase [Candidatus Latescibacterota bacterium]